MKFSNRIFYGILSTTLLVALILLSAFYVISERNIHAAFTSKYLLLGESVKTAFHQMESLSDSLSKNAGFVLRADMNKNGLPSNTKLRNLAKELGVKSFYILNNNGMFIRASDISLKRETNSIFKYCKQYRQLVSGSLDHIVTPIMPGWPIAVPSKFTMLSSESKHYIIDVGMNLQHIDKLLRRTLSDKAIKGIGLFSPNGHPLGYMDAQGKFSYGKKAITNKNKFLSDAYSTFNYKIPSTIKTCCECTFKNIQTKNNAPYFYLLKMQVSRADILRGTTHLKWMIFWLSILAFILAFIISRFISKQLTRKLNDINRQVSNIAASGDLEMPLDNQGSTDEVGLLAVALERMREKIKSSQKKLVEQEREKSIANLAGQVAHDIQSPLTALKALLQSVDKMNEKQRVLFRRATERIIDITNLLLIHYRDTTAVPSYDKDLSSEILFCLVSEILSEKRLEYKNSEIEFTLETDGKSYASFAHINLYEFKRVISNLVNNAIEAIDDKSSRKVTLSLSTSTKNIAIKVIDTGCGMDEKTKDKLFESKTESNKHSGEAIGLVTAQHSVQIWQGSIKVDSTLNIGTTITINLPIAAWPLWFSGNILVSPDIKTVAILDDDPSIHDVWEARFKGAEQDLVLEHFKKSSDFKTWIKSCDINRTLLLIDYELLDEEDTGLDVIESLNLTKNCYLVTSRYEEPDVRERSIKKHISIIPKYYANYVLIRYIKNTPIVLIDNEETVHTTWEFAAELSGVNLKLYKTPTAFWADSDNIVKEAIIYLDSNLDEGMKGEDFVNDIYNAGFHTIYLATGEVETNFKNVPFIKGVSDKEPPF